jgi:hypothetical protein
VRLRSHRRWASLAAEYVRTYHCNIEKDAFTSISAGPSAWRIVFGKSAMPTMAAPAAAGATR